MAALTGSGGAMFAGRISMAAQSFASACHTAVRKSGKVFVQNVADPEVLKSVAGKHILRSVAQRQRHRHVYDEGLPQMLSRTGSRPHQPYQGCRECLLSDRRAASQLHHGNGPWSPSRSPGPSSHCIVSVCEATIEVFKLANFRSASDSCLQT